MRKLFKKKDRQKHQKMLKPIEVDFDRIDAYVLKKYGLADIKKKDVFILLNLLFMVSGIISIVAFLYGSINAVTVTGGLITLSIGCAIFRMVKINGIKIEEKNEKEETEK